MLWELHHSITSVPEGDQQGSHEMGEEHGEGNSILQDRITEVQDKLVNLQYQARDRNIMPDACL